MRLIILGGSFNPVHLGHLFLAEEVLSSLHYDRIVFVPAYRSPFKLAAKDMEDTAAYRLEMLSASLAGDPRLAIDDCEIRRGGVSYTSDTLKDIISRYSPAGKPGLVIGDDLADEFPQWHKSDEILELADIIIARRVHSGEFNCPYPHTLIKNEAIDISSAQVRSLIEEGKAWHYLVPVATRTIIEEKRLYMREEGESFYGTILRVEQAVREELGHKRFLHSRNTALLAWDLCHRFSVNPELGYLAGMGHDLAKSLDAESLLKLAKSDGGGISKLHKEKPTLLHGRSAAVLLRERFGINNEDVLEAVALHTEGGVKMGTLAKIIYIADKVEVSREKADPALRAMCYAENDLDRIFYAVLGETVSWLRSRQIDLSENTMGLLKKINLDEGRQ
jgi:nicotinate-nucleotide adenylyltransferase